jgi:hypothetical protein
VKFDQRVPGLYVAVLAAVGTSLAAALVGWLGGLGPPYREFRWDTAERVGIAVTFLLLPYLLVMTVQARRVGVPYGWRAFGWVLCLMSLLLPAILLANTFLDAPGYSAFGCGSLFNPMDLSGDTTAQAVCEPVRARRAGWAWSAAAIGASIAAAVGTSALRPASRRIEA